MLRLRIEPDNLTAIVMLEKVLLLLLVVFYGSHQQCLSPNDAPEFAGPPRYADWLTSQHNFSVSLMQALNKQRNGKDIVFSPVSIHELLLLLYFGAGGGTEKSLTRVLQIPFLQKKATTWNFYKNHKIDDIEDVDFAYPLRTATKIFLSNKIRLRPCMQQLFRSEMELIDIQSNELDAQNHINEWVEKRTFGQIKDYIKNITQRPAATLVNAAYFKGTWEYKFIGTRYLLFHVSDSENARIEMMYIRDYVYKGFNPQLGAHTMLLPFRGNDIVMVILLPTIDVDDMIAAMNDGTIQYITDRRNLKLEQLALYIPKFEFKNEINLKNAMEILGSGSTFTTFSDLSGFTGRRNIFTSNMKHSAAIKVDEEGSKTVILDSRFPKSPPTLILDRPFAYVIYDVLVQKVLLMGVFSYPEVAHNI